MFDSKRTLLFVGMLTVLGWAGASMAQAADATGAEIFAKNCAMCHGKDGKGTTKMGESMKLKDLTAEKLDKAKVAGIVKDGIKNEAVPGKDMKGFAGKLDDAQIAAVADYVAGGLK